MSQIIDRIYLGSFEDVLDGGWDLVISLVTSKEYDDLEGFLRWEAYHFPICDGPAGVEEILKGYPSIETLINQNSHRKILIHCNRGISRSPTVLIMYLINQRGFTQMEAILHVRKCRPIIKPNPYFMEMIDDM